MTVVLVLLAVCSTAPDAFAVSSDFWVTLEGERLNFPSRLRLQMRRFRAARTIAVFENKLLRDSFVRARVGPNHAIQPILYGAFSGPRGGMGEWPAYRRED